MAPDRTWGGTLCPLMSLGLPTTERPVRLGAWRADSSSGGGMRLAVGFQASGGPNGEEGRNSAPCVVDGHATASVCS